MTGIQLHILPSDHLFISVVPQRRNVDTPAIEALLSIRPRPTPTCEDSRRVRRGRGPAVRPSAGTSALALSTTFEAFPSRSRFAFTPRTTREPGWVTGSPAGRVEGGPVPSAIRPGLCPRPRAPPSLPRIPGPCTPGLHPALRRRSRCVRRKRRDIKRAKTLHACTRTKGGVQNVRRRDKGGRLSLK